MIQLLDVFFFVKF